MIDKVNRLGNHDGREERADRLLMAAPVCPVIMFIRRHSFRPVGFGWSSLGWF